MCRGSNYNSTQLLNSLGHGTQEAAGLEVQQYFPLVKIQCSPFLAPFVCSLYLPPCTHSAGVLLPCRSLCERAKAGCTNVMMQFGLTWPDQMRCDKLPDEEEDKPCFRGPTFPSATPPPSGTYSTMYCYFHRLK